MANIKSQKKRIKTNEKRRIRNTSIRSRMKTMVKKAIQGLTSSDEKIRQASVLEAISSIDRACAKGVIHRNAAARRKSRLMKQVNKALGAN